MSSVGGMAVGALGGFSIPPIGKIFKGFELKPIIKRVRLPPIVGMIIMGCVGRNYI
jgi:hypothetical protein